MILYNLYDVLDFSVNGCPAKGLNITGSFQINDVGCLGMENSLLQCCHTEDVADCVDTEAVVVECEGGVYLHVCISNDTPKRYVVVYRPERTIICTLCACVEAPTWN